MLKYDPDIFYDTKKTTCKYRLTTKLFLEMPNDRDSGTTAQFRIGTEKAMMKCDC